MTTAPPFEVVDSYSHCGLHKYQPVEVVRQTMGSAGVSRAVLVQHLGEFDNSYIGGIARAEPARFAAVCLVDYTSPDALRELERLAATGDFRGIRVTDEMLRKAPELVSAAVRLDFNVVLSALGGAHTCVTELRALLDAEPDCRLTITHLGRPIVGEAPDFATHRPVFALAEYPGVYFQLSGMKMWMPLPHEPLYPLIEMAVEAFGASRLLWGSNYPVVGDASDYAADLRLLLDGRLPVLADAIPAIAGGNARVLWFDRE